MEEVFHRVAKVVHLHVGGQVIRTTAEHPFWVHDKGWLPARELAPGEFLIGLDGQRVVIDEVYDTGEWEAVYNLRVADFHTYFVGSDEWGFSVWAHNIACTLEDVIAAIKDVRPNTRLGKAYAQRVANAINTGETNTAKAILQDTVKGVGQVRAQTIAEALVAKANLYERPSPFRSGVRDAVWDAAKGKDGKVRDPLTDKVMNKNEPWDMGHRPGFEFKSHQESARQRGITREQFIEEHNTPSHYRPELPSGNRSHMGELKTGEYFGY